MARPVGVMDIRTTRRLRKQLPLSLIGSMPIRIFQNLLQDSWNRTLHLPNTQHNRARDRETIRQLLIFQQLSLQFQILILEQWAQQNVNSPDTSRHYLREHQNIHSQRRSLELL